MAVLSPSEQAQVIAARSRQYHSFRDVPQEAFPLFLSGKQWLAMLDATVPEQFLKCVCAASAVQHPVQRPVQLWADVCAAGSRERTRFAALSQRMRLHPRSMRQSSNDCGCLCLQAP
jgi:hypothetical protein